MSAPSTIDPQHKADMLARLRRVEGQLRGVQAMIDGDTPCEQVAQQLSAARKALDKAFFYMVGCVIEQQGRPVDARRGRLSGEDIAAMLVKFG